MLNSELPLNSRYGPGTSELSDLLLIEPVDTIPYRNSTRGCMIISSLRMKVVRKKRNMNRMMRPRRRRVSGLKRCKKNVSASWRLDFCNLANIFTSVTTTQREDPVEVGAEDTEEPSTSTSTNTSRKRKRSKGSPAPDPKSRKRKHRKGTGDKEYGVTRGVDFVDVACVLNFDLPTSSRSYTHRVGRTARAGRTGMSLSFVVPADQWGKNKVVGCLPSAKDDEVVYEKIEKEQGARGSKIKEYNFDMKQVEAFRYRMEDALRSVTRSAIKEARIKELKTEILNSDKLKVSNDWFFSSVKCLIDVCFFIW